MRTPLLLILALLATACASGSRADSAPRAEEHPALEHQLAYTHTHEIRFGTSERVTGYLVEFLRLPEGVELKREFPAGTVLLQDLACASVAQIPCQDQALGAEFPQSQAETKDSLRAPLAALEGREVHPPVFGGT